MAVMLAAAVPLWPIYQHPYLFVTVGGGIVAGAAIAFAGARWRWPGAAVAAASALSYLLIGVPLAVPGDTLFGALPSLEGTRRLVLGSAFSWKQMLSVALPLGDYGGLLIPVLMLVFAGTVIGLSVVLRARRTGWALLCPAALYVFGIVFGGKSPSSPFWPFASGALLLAMVLLWVIRAVGYHRSGRGLDARLRQAQRADRARRSMAALTLAAVCLAGGTALATIAQPVQARQVARDAVEPPFDPHDYLSPLVGYRNSVLPPADTAHLLTVRGLPAGARIRLAALDDYNGLVFAVGPNPASDASGAFERVPLRVQRDKPAGRTVRVAVAIDGLRGVWLPTVGQLTSIHFTGSDASARADDFFYNHTASAAALLGGVRKGLSYTLDTTVSPISTDVELARSRPGATHQAGAAAIPEALVEAVKKQAATGSPGAKLVALANWLRSGYVSDSGSNEPFSRPGHSDYRLAALVTETPMLGDAEQYAPALALMARELGYPSRVVLGFAPKVGASGTVIVAGGDLTAWVEVQEAGGAWLAIDPNPPAREVPKEKRTSTDVVAHPQTVPPPPPPTRQDAVSSSSTDGKDKSPQPVVPQWLLIVQAVLNVAAVVAPIVAIVLAPLWMVALIRAVLRRTRRKRDRQRTVLTGAWDEVRDRISELGVVPVRSATRIEVVALAQASAAMPLAKRLADRADRAVFDTAELSATEVEAYWADVRALRRRLVSGLNRWERAKVLLSWRAILSRARTMPRIDGRSTWRSRSSSTSATDSG